MLDQYEKVEKCIAEGRYYHALKSLEYLEHYQLKSIQSYSFSQALVKRIPELRAEIKAASLAQVTDFLEEVRKHSTRLGAIAMHQTAAKAGMQEDFFEDNKVTNGKVKDEAIVMKKTRSSSDCDDSDVETPQTRSQPSSIRRSSVFQSNRLSEFYALFALTYGEILMC